MSEQSRRILARLELPLILLIAWAAMMLVRPYGDFPLFDDENHAIGTWNFVHTGHFIFTKSTSPPLRSQVVWGAIWTRFFGESFDVLRASTMVLAALTLIIVNRMLAEAGVVPGLRILATLAFFFNPAFFWNAHTYMTEVPFVFASAMAMYGFLRGLREEKVGWMIAGCVFVAISWWIRQGALNALPPIALVLIYRQRLTPRWRTFILPPIVTALAFAGLWLLKREWMIASEGEFHYHWKMWTEESFRLPQMVSLVVSYVMQNIHNTTILFLPLSIGTLFALPHLRAKWQRVVVIFCALAFALGATWIAAHHTAWPWYPANRALEISPGNLIGNVTLGPPTMNDVSTGVHEYPFGVSFGARVTAMYATALLAGITLAVVAIAVARAAPQPRQNLIILLPLMHTVICTASLPVAWQVFDRYALDTAWSAGLALPLMIPWREVRARIACTIALVAIAVFSVLATQEYFAWNRARWAAYWELRNHGVPLKQIDGGAEPLLYYEVAVAGTDAERRKLAFGAGKRPYVLAFSPMKGFRVIARHPWSAWLGTRRSAVVTLQRVDG